MRLKVLAATIAAFTSFGASANIVGTDFQNFNPTTSGLDFVTVQSSETLQPCIINMGLFFNYAANSLTYSQTLNNTVSGQKRRDRMLSDDLSFGMGLTDRWDFGVNLPMILKQTVTNDYYVSSFGQGGFTEIKANTKYRFIGDDSGGLAGIFSINHNFIQDNPFSGHNPKPTLNFELAADTTLASRWNLGVNAGYRKRTPGSAIAGQPFVPMGDQYIYSAAASYLVASIDTKVIMELYGASAAKRLNQDTDRNLSALEALVGVKHDYSQNIAMHLGFTKQVDASVGGPDWRIYAGLNWTMGPVCKHESPKVEKVAPPPPPAEPAPAPAEPTPPPTEVFNLNIELLFALNSDKIAPEHLEGLDAFLDGLKDRGFDKIVVEGHTDSLGAADYNMGLSMRRAKRVRAYMVEKHKMSADKIEAEGFGLTRPIADNGNYQGRQKNRRVEFKVWRGK
jgi:outer membrane protein OmpA-like peptidoglycan-associated protein